MYVCVGGGGEGFIVNMPTYWGFAGEWESGIQPGGKKFDTLLA